MGLVDRLIRRKRRVKFNYNAWLIRDALGLSPKESQSVLSTVERALKETRVISETIEYIYNKYKDDERKLIYGILAIGMVVGDNLREGNVGGIEELPEEANTEITAVGG